MGRPRPCSLTPSSIAAHSASTPVFFFIMLPLCILTAVSALLLDRFVGPPLWAHMVIWPIFIAVIVGYSLRPVKALMIGLQYRYRDVEHEGRN